MDKIEHEKIRELMLKLYDAINEAYDKEPEMLNNLGFEEPFERLEEKINKH